MDGLALFEKKMDFIQNDPNAIIEYLISIQNDQYCLERFIQKIILLFMNENNYEMLQFMFQEISNYEFNHYDLLNFICNNWKHGNIFNDVIKLFITNFSTFDFSIDNWIIFNKLAGIKKFETLKMLLDYCDNFDLCNKPKLLFDICAHYDSNDNLEMVIYLLDKYPNYDIYNDYKQILYLASNGYNHDIIKYIIENYPNGDIHFDDDWLLITSGINFKKYLIENYYFDYWCHTKIQY